MSGAALSPELMDALQREAFDYFLYEANPLNGLIADKTQAGWPASIAAVGFALSAYPVGVERGFMTRANAAQRTLATLRFFHSSVQSRDADATGYKGFYYHFLDMKDGKRAWNCELSTIDTALLLAGMLTAAQYFSGDDAEDCEIRKLADALYRRADWNWAQNGAPTVTLGWKSRGGFLRYRWQGYNEGLLIYLLGLGSPTHPLPVESYPQWTATYQSRKVYDQDFLYAGPLFTHQFPHVWVDFRGIQDEYMRGKRSDYFDNSRRATHVHRQYAIANPGRFSGYGENGWGFTASDGPGPATCRINGEEATLFWLRSSRRARRTRRRQPRSVGGRRLLAIRARDRRTGSAIFRDAEVAGRQPLWIQGHFQRHDRREIRSAAVMGFAVSLRHQPGAHRPDDRKLPLGSHLESDATMSLYRGRARQGRLYRWLARHAEGGAFGLRGPNYSLREPPISGGS
jgi:hypothetical protein